MCTRADVHTRQWKQGECASCEPALILLGQLAEVGSASGLVFSNSVAGRGGKAAQQGGHARQGWGMPRVEGGASASARCQRPVRARATQPSKVCT